MASEAFKAATGLTSTAQECWDADPGPNGSTKWHWLRVSRAVLALLPGRTEAEVKAEALREAASELHDWAALHAGPDGAYFARLWESRLRDRADFTEREG